MTKETKELITNSIQLVLKKIDEKEMSELKDEIRTIKKKDEKDEAKKWDLAKIFLASVVAAAVTSAVMYLKGQ